MPSKHHERVSAAKVSAEESSADLLAYYKTRVDDFERERASLLESVEKCSVQASELHRLEWENRKRCDEIRDLQKALSDAHKFLFDERQRLLALQAENDDLRLQEIEDRKRIQQLLAYEQPLAAGGMRMHPSAVGGIMGPSTDHLLLKLESLQAQLDEQKQLAAERMAALLDDRQIRETEEAAHREMYSRKLDDMDAKLKRTEEMLRQTTKDYILARRDKQSAETRALTAEAELQQERVTLYEELTQVKQSTSEDLARTRQQAESRLEDVATNLRKQLKQSEDEVISLTSIGQSLKVQYEKRIGELEGRLGKCAESNRQLELRRHLDMQGWDADVAALRRQVNAVDRKLHEMRLIDRLEDDERLDTILDNLRRKAGGPSASHQPHHTDAPPRGIRSGRDNSGSDSSRRDNGSGAAGHSGGRDHGHGGSSSEASSVKSELVKTVRDLRGGLRGLQEKVALRKASSSAHEQRTGSATSHQGALRKA